MPPIANGLVVVLLLLMFFRVWVVFKDFSDQDADQLSRLDEAVASAQQTLADAEKVTRELTTTARQVASSGTAGEKRGAALVTGATEAGQTISAAADELQSSKATQEIRDGPAPVRILFWHVGLTRTTAPLVIVMIAGALAGATRSLMASTRLRGEGKWGPRWVPWHLSRSLVGAAIALLAHFLIHAGLVNVAFSDVSTAVISPYGEVAIAVVAGLYADNVEAKLRKTLLAQYAEQKAAGPSQDTKSDGQPDQLGEAAKGKGSG